MNRTSVQGARGARFLRSLLVLTAVLLTHERADAQLTYTKGQTVSPAYEGFEANPDGSYNLLFGYMNRNWLEEVDVSTGPDNFFSPGPEDRGQPSHFLPRRNRFIFKVQVPADFGDQELVWTLTVQGVTKRAYATLRQDLLIDNMVIASETGALGAGRSDPETRSNVAPMIEIEGSQVRRVLVGQSVTLVARVTDDGLPITRAARRARAVAAREAAEATAAEASDAEPDSVAGDDSEEDSSDDTAQEDEEDEEEEISPELQALRRALNEPNRVTVQKRVGLHFTWFVYRGENHATFAPIQIKPWEDSRAFMNSPWSPFWEAPPTPEDDRWVVQVTFDEPGTYVLRGRADDGALYADEEVTITVTPRPISKPQLGTRAPTHVVLTRVRLEGSLRARNPMEPNTFADEFS